MVYKDIFIQLQQNYAATKVLKYKTLVNLIYLSTFAFGL